MNNSWIKKGLVSFVLSTSKMEKDALAQSSEEVERNNQGIVNPYQRNQLMQDLQEGRLTQRVKEFRKKYYEVLRESAKYKYKDGQLLTEEEVRASKVAEGDPYDSYKVEIIFSNKPIGVSLFEGGEVRPLKIQRGVISANKIENCTSVIHVRDIDGKNKLIDFYIPKNTDNRLIVREIENLKRNPKVTDFVNFTKMSFTTQDAEMLVFEYKMLAFDKIVEYNDNYIVKMFAECVTDGRWLGDRYMIVD